jgi:hypothetical protein
VSREYYGAFHLASSFVEQLGAIVPRNATGHFELSRLLWDSGQADAQDVADRRAGHRNAFLDDLTTVRRVEGLDRGRVTGVLRGH